MRKKIVAVLNKIYGVMMTASFFGGFLPLIPFVIAIIIGGEAGGAISVFLYKQYYPWVIIVGSLAIIIGVVAMYVGKIEGLSLNKVSADSSDEKEAQSAEK